MEEWNKEEEKRIYGAEDDWRSQSLAGSSIVKCRKVSSTTFFTKGILNEIGYTLKEKTEVNVVYVNATLTSMQQKKLEKRWNDILNENDDRMRQFYLKSANKNEMSPTEMETDTEISSMDISREERDELMAARGLTDNQRKIRVIDRFGIILQIFASRAKHRSAQL